MVGTLLTVAVPTIPGRESLLSRCLWSITTQAPESVEVLVIPGPGQLGDKANAAAEAATGRHMVLVDDDDYLAADYCAHVLPALEADPDYVGYRVLQIINLKFYGQSYTRGDLNDFGRRGHGPVPKGATRTDIWRSSPMANHYTADRDWCRAVAKKIVTHEFIDRDLYVYDHVERASAFIGHGEQRDVGVWPFDGSRVRYIAPA